MLGFTVGDCFAWCLCGLLLVCEVLFGDIQVRWVQRQCVCVCVLMWGAFRGARLRDSPFLFQLHFSQIGQEIGGWGGLGCSPHSGAQAEMERGCSRERGTDSCSKRQTDLVSQTKTLRVFNFCYNLSLSLFRSLLSIVCTFPNFLS